MGQSVFEAFHRAIIEAQDGEKEKIKPEPESQETCQNQSPDPSEEGSPLVLEDEDNIHKAVPTHPGKLILDATVVEQAIRYPTDLS